MCAPKNKGAFRRARPTLDKAPNLSGDAPEKQSLQLADPMASPRARAPDALVTPHDFSGECIDCSTFA